MHNADTVVMCEKQKPRAVTRRGGALPEIVQHMDQVVQAAAQTVKLAHSQGIAVFRSLEATARGG